VSSDIRVKLKEDGEHILKKYDEKYSCNKDGYHTFQLWKFMNIFGDKIHLGCNPPFETTIYFEQ